jgi:rod shape determining protein RodA
MLSLLEPQYVILIALLAVIIVHFKSRMSHRNIVLSAILFANVRVRFVRKLCFQNVFKQHHRDRFNILLGKTVDLKGIGIIQTNLRSPSDPEAGLGKVFLKDPNQRSSLPEQHTDYIFTTVGEEWDLQAL